MDIMKNEKIYNSLCINCRGNNNCTNDKNGGVVMIKKSKGIIIVDMPDNCNRCRFYYFARYGHTGKLCGGCRIIPNVAIRDSSVKQDWCPIKLMPEKKERPFIPYNRSDGYSHGYVAGWNCCVDEISRKE